MIVIKKSEVLDFFSRIAPIKHNGMLPILDYVQLDAGTDMGVFYETSMNTWCIHEVALETKKPAKILLDKRRLKALVTSTTADTIKISWKVVKKESEPDVTTVKLEAEGNPPISFVVAGGQYPLPPEKPENQGITTLNPDFLKVINQSRDFIGDPGQAMPWFDYIHIIGADKSANLFASNGALIFNQQFDYAIPNIKLTAETAQIISMYKESCSYYVCQNYDFFDFGRTQYGFIKPEIPTPQFDTLMQQFSEQEYFSIDRDRLITFSSQAIKVSTTGSTAIFELKGEKEGKKSFINLLYEEPEYGISQPERIEVKANFVIPEFSFNAGQLATCLKAIDNETVVFYAAKNAYFVKGPENKSLTLMIMGFKKTSNV